MRSTESVVVAATPSEIFPFVASLDQYPKWLRLVHHAVDEAGTSDAWIVEIRAQIGPFARSKQLRMERTEYVENEQASFERAERDGRDHARWALQVELRPLGERECEVKMHLAYDGVLWTGGLLQRALDDEVRRGREGLSKLVSDAPTR